MELCTVDSRITGYIETDTRAWMSSKGIAAGDIAMMTRCLELSKEAAAAGEIPFACLISKDGAAVAEASNRVVRDKDVTRHAELVALTQAQQALGTRILSGCTLYSIVEPCPMCAFPVREAQISRVVFALRSPLMGGLSKWNILRDDELARVMPEAFGNVPEVVIGVLAQEAEAVWKAWSPIAWRVIRYRGCFEGAEAAPVFEQLAGTKGRRFFRQLLAIHR
jgi:tRNA(adenine34) deaminase